MLCQSNIVGAVNKCIPGNSRGGAVRLADTTVYNKQLAPGLYGVFSGFYRYMAINNAGFIWL